MGRKIDEERKQLIEKLGLQDSKKNWSKKELLALVAKQEAKQKKIEEAKAITQLIAGDVPSNMTPAEMEIPYDLREQQEDPFSGLTERQKMIARLRMRGLSQQAIANVVGVAQPIISKELKRIKEWQTERGASVEQAAIVGNSSSLYEEIEYRAWELYHRTEEVPEKAKALSLVMAARDKHTKLLMDLGLLKRAASETKHTLDVNPFIEKWKDGTAKKNLADSIVIGQLPELAEPTLDENIEDADIIDGEEDDE